MVRALKNNYDQAYIRELLFRRGLPYKWVDPSCQIRKIVGFACETNIDTSHFVHKYIRCFPRIHNAISLTFQMILKSRPNTWRSGKTIELSGDGEERNITTPCKQCPGSSTRKTISWYRSYQSAFLANPANVRKYKHAIYILRVKTWNVWFWN